MRILGAVLMALLLLAAAAKINRVIVPDYDHTHPHDPKAQSMVRKALGRINYMLNTPNADYSVTRHWLQHHNGKNFWLWLKNKQENWRVASVQLFEDKNGKVHVVRAVPGL